MFLKCRYILIILSYIFIEHYVLITLSSLF